MIRLREDTDLRELLSRAFDLSFAQGMSAMVDQPGPLTAKEADLVLKNTSGRVVLSADYVRGRSVKLMVYRDEIGLYVSDRWHDHTDGEWAALLEPYREQ